MTTAGRVQALESMLTAYPDIFTPEQCFEMLNPSDSSVPLIPPLEEAQRLTGVDITPTNNFSTYGEPAYAPKINVLPNPHIEDGKMYMINTPYSPNTLFVPPDVEQDVKKYLEKEKIIDPMPNAGILQASHKMIEDFQKERPMKILKVRDDYYEIIESEVCMDSNSYKVKCNRVLSYESPIFEFGGDKFFHINCADMSRMKKASDVSEEDFKREIKTRTRNLWREINKKEEDYGCALSVDAINTRDSFIKTFSHDEFMTFTKNIEKYDDEKINGLLSGNLSKETYMKFDSDVDAVLTTSHDKDDEYLVYNVSEQQFDTKPWAELVNTSNKKARPFQGIPRVKKVNDSFCTCDEGHFKYFNEHRKDCPSYQQIWSDEITCFSPYSGMYKINFNNGAEIVFDENIKDSCECGAKHTDFPNHHMKFCPLDK